MRTRPIERIVGRETIPELQNHLEDLADAVQEVVGFGSHVLSWMPDESKHGDYQLPALLMVRHVLELLDAVSLLLRRSSVEPCKLMLRGVLECSLGLQYLLREDTDRRAMAFMVWHTHDRIKKHRQFDPSTAEGQQFAGTLKSGQLLGNFEVGDSPRVKAVITSLESALKVPHFAEAEKEYQRTKEERKRRGRNQSFAWYSLYDGPNTIEELARHLGHADLYEAFYRAWSGPMHGTDIMAGKVVVGNGTAPRMIALRYPREAQPLTQVATTLGQQVLKVVVCRLAPDKSDEYLKWHLRYGEFFKYVYGKPLFTIDLE